MNVKSLVDENKRLRAWVADLQSGMFVNCVYCGHRYGPGETTPVSMADALKAHVEQCPKHPMSALRTRLAAADRLAEVLRNLDLLDDLEAHWEDAFEGELPKIREALAAYNATKENNVDKE